MEFLLIIILICVIFILVINYHRRKYICDIIKNYNPSMITMKDLFKMNQFNGKNINGVFSTWGHKVMEKNVYVLSSNKLNLLHEELTSKFSKVKVDFIAGISNGIHKKFYRFDECSLEMLKHFFNSSSNKTDISPVVILEIIIPFSTTRFYIASLFNIPEFLKDEYNSQLIIFNAIDRFMREDSEPVSNIHSTIFFNKSQHSPKQIKKG